MYAKPMPLVSPVKSFWPADILDLVKKSKYTQNLKYEHFFQGFFSPMMSHFIATSRYPYPNRETIPEAVYEKRCHRVCFRPKWRR